MTKFRVQKRGVFHSLSLGALVGGDGAFGVEPVAALTSATVRLLTASGASWTSSAFKGLPAWVVDKSAGTATRVKIADNTGTALTLEEDMDTAPVAGDQVVIGGIYMDLEVDDLDSLKRRCMRERIELLDERRDEHGQAVTLRDTEGNLLNLFQAGTVA